MKLNDDEQRLLSTEDYYSNGDETVRRRAEADRWHCGRNLGIVLLSCFFVSISLNLIALFRSWPQGESSTAETTTRTRRPSYSGLDYDVPQTYTYYTVFWNETRILNEENWESLSIDPIAIAVTKEWAVEHDLPPSGEFPWDPSKQLYFVKVFHQIHCLKLIRHTLKAYEAHEGNPAMMEHVGHCLDSLRQDIMCHADDTPMPVTRPEHSLGDGQMTKCMDFEKLVAWTQHPDRNACHKHLNEYGHIHNSIERYGYCAEDSPYHARMSAYFEKFGHKDPFE